MLMNKIKIRLIEGSMLKIALNVIKDSIKKNNKRLEFGINAIEKMKGKIHEHV
jgi:hypothetical protein